MACDALRFSGVDASKWDRAKDTISKEYGMSVESENGEGSKSGFTLAWTYDSSARTLEIQCRDKPFVVPCAASDMTTGTSYGLSNDRSTAAAPAIEPNSGRTKSDRQSPSRFSAGMTSGASAAPETSPAYVASIRTG